METKRCPHCKQTKSVTEFYPSKTQSGGYRLYCKTCMLELYNLAVKKDPLKHKIQHKKSNQKVKKITLAHYGNGKLACVICGESRLACLSLDHTKGGGGKERATLPLWQQGGPAFYRWLRKNNYPEGYQTLCMNCQFVKKEENGEYGNQYSKRGVEMSMIEGLKKGALLTTKEIKDAIWLACVKNKEVNGGMVVAKAQDTKTASIKDAENRELGLLLEAEIRGAEETNDWSPHGLREFRPKVLLIIKLHYEKLKAGGLGILSKYLDEKDQECQQRVEGMEDKLKAGCEKKHIHISAETWEAIKLEARQK